MNGRLILAGAPRFNLVVCGGSALAATGLVTRTTKDVDIVALMNDEGVLLDPSPLPKALVRAAHEVALDLGFISRYDQVHFKLYAAVDQSGSYHAEDLRELQPTDAELLAAAG